MVGSPYLGSQVLYRRVGGVAEEGHFTRKQPVAETGDAYPQGQRLREAPRTPTASPTYSMPSKSVPA